MELNQIILWLLGGLVTLLVASYGWFITSTLAKIDKNQTKLSENVTSLATTLARLEGRYEALERKIS